jgi:hypothetical protein
MNSSTIGGILAIAQSLAAASDEDIKADGDSMFELLMIAIEGLTPKAVIGEHRRVNHGFRMVTRDDDFVQVGSGKRPGLTDEQARKLGNAGLAWVCYHKTKGHVAASWSDERGHVRVRLIFADKGEVVDYAGGTALRRAASTSPRVIP